MLSFRDAEKVQYPEEVMEQNARLYMAIIASEKIAL